MRKTIALVTMVVLIVGMLPLVASAATIDAAAFAADCNADGEVSVTGTLKVIGGEGDITVPNCFVTIADGGKLIFTNTYLHTNSCSQPVGCSLIVGNSGADSAIKVIRSTIDVSGTLQLSAGCCSGGEVPDTNGFIRVVRSYVSGSSVELSASVASEDGRVLVRRSTIVATGEFGFTDDVQISTFNNGVVRFNDNTVVSPGDATVTSGVTGFPGDTKAKRNDFTEVTGNVTITANGGPCVSVHNTPVVACS